MALLTSEVKSLASLEILASLEMLAFSGRVLAASWVILASKQWHPLSPLLSMKLPF